MGNKKLRNAEIRMQNENSHLHLRAVQVSFVILHSKLDVVP